MARVPQLCGVVEGALGGGGGTETFLSNQRRGVAAKVLRASSALCLVFVASTQRCSAKIPYANRPRTLFWAGVVIS